jgi:hypothetical protein
VGEKPIHALKGRYNSKAKEVMQKERHEGCGRCAIEFESTAVESVVVVVHLRYNKARTVVTDIVGKIDSIFTRREWN